MVEWKTIEEIGSYFGGLTGKTKEDFEDGNAKFITYMNVFANSSLNPSLAGVVRINKGEKQNKVQKGDILFTGSSETPEEAGMSCVITDELGEDFYMNSFCFGLRLSNSERYNLHYFKHLLRSESIRKSIAKTASGVTRFNISKARFGKIQIPIPPLSEQTRIVGILDAFTASIENLKEQIAERRKQYEHYRDQLLDLEGKEGVEMKMLGEVCNIKGRIGFRGYTREDQVSEGEGVISLSPGNIEEGKMDYDGCTYITWEKYNESPEIMTFNGDIIFCKTGSTVGKVAMVECLPCEATINPQLVVLKDVSVNLKFLKYSLGTFRIQSIVKRLAGVGSVPNISQEKLGNLEIYFPSLQEQSRIVSILDTFEASIANLEAQLKEREKQYEYYRNKLLTFE